MSYKNQKIESPKAPPALGPYSQGIVTGNLVFLAGQTGLVGDTGKLAEGGIKGQTVQILENIKAVLAAKNLTFDNVVKTTVFLTDINDFATMNEIYAQHFKAPYPARSTVAVAALPKNACVEIECVAAIE